MQTDFSDPRTFVSIEFTFSSSAEEVWKAWTDADFISKWFGSDPNGKVLSAQLDVRIGGQFKISFIDSDLTEHTCYGTYLDIEPQQKLSFTWSWKNEPGLESLVNINLKEEDDKTILSFIHADLSPESKHGYLEGWQRTFTKLENILKQ